MSNEFNALRARAKARRDKAVTAIQEEYQAALVQIAKLEQDLLGRQSRTALSRRPISACIDSILPKDRPFTTVDVMTALEALDSSRYWRKRSADFHIGKLRRIGVIRRLRRATIHEPALYVVADSPATPPAATADKTLAEVIRGVLTRPMSLTEVVLAVTDAGYRSSMSRGNLRQHVHRELKARFKFDGTKWTKV